MADDVVYPVPDGTIIRAIDLGSGKLAQVVFTAPFAIPLSFETVAVTTSAALPTVPAAAQCATIFVEGGAIRWRPDGASTAPTSTVGMLLPDGATVALGYGQVALLTTRVIAASGTPVISVVYS